MDKRVSYARVDDAVFVVALQRYLVARMRFGERVTKSAAARLAERATSMGLRMGTDLQALGFIVTGQVVRPLHHRLMIAALRRVHAEGRIRDVHALCNPLFTLTVAQLEEARWTSGLRL